MKAHGDRRWLVFVGLAFALGAAWTLTPGPIPLTRDGCASTLAFVGAGQLTLMEGGPREALFLDGLGLVGWVVKRRARPRRSKVRPAQLDIR